MKGFLHRAFRTRLFQPPPFFFFVFIMSLSRCCSSFLALNPQKRLIQAGQEKWHNHQRRKGIFFFLTSSFIVSLSLGFHYIPPPPQPPSPLLFSLTCREKAGGSFEKEEGSIIFLSGVYNFEKASRCLGRELKIFVFGDLLVAEPNGWAEWKREWWNSSAKVIEQLLYLMIGPIEREFLSFFSFVFLFLGYSRFPFRLRQICGEHCHLLSSFSPSLTWSCPSLRLDKVDFS